MFKKIGKTNFNLFYGIFLLLLGCLFVSNNSKECFILDISSNYRYRIGENLKYAETIEIKEEIEIDTTNNAANVQTTYFKWYTWGIQQYLYSLSFNYTINNHKLNLIAFNVTFYHFRTSDYIPFQINQKVTADLTKVNEYNGINTPFSEIVSTKYTNLLLTINSYYIKLSPCTIKATTVTRIVPTSTTTPIETSTKKPETESETTNETENVSTTKNDQTKHGNVNPFYTALKRILIPIVITGMLLIPIILFSLKKYKQHRVVTSGPNTAQDA